MIKSFILNTLFELIKKGINNLVQTNPMKKTIERLSTKYKGIENLSNTLEAWLQNENVSNQVSEITKGKDEISINDLVLALVKYGGFYFGKETPQKSIKIINDFFSILNEEYLKSPEAVLYHDYKEEERHREIIEQMNRTGEKITKKLEANAQLMKLASGIPLIDEWKDKYKTQYTKRINEARELLLEGKVKIAKKFYKAIIDDLEKEKDFHKELHFRALTNLGCCELELDNNEEATFYFEKAHSLLPEEPKGLANMAVTKKLKGDISAGLEYIDKLLSKHPKDYYGICLKATLLLDEGKFNEAINIFKTPGGESFDQELLKDAHCNFTLGYIYYQRKKYTNAQKYLKQACLIDSSNPDYFFILGLSFCFPLLKKKDFPWLLSEKSKQKLILGEENLTKAFSILKKQEKDNKLETILVNRSAVRIALSDYIGAKKDGELVLSINPHSYNAIRNKAIAEGFDGQFNQAIETLSSLLEDKRYNKEIVPMIVYAYLNKSPSEPEKAIEIINKYFPQKKVSIKNLNIKIDLAECYIENSEFQKADNLINEIKKIYPDNRRLLFLMFRYFKNKNNFKKAALYMQRALDKARGMEKKIISLELANYYFKYKFYDKAIPYYEEIVNLNNNNAVLRSYLACLYNSENKKLNHPKLLKICENFRKKNGITQLVTEIEAALLESTFDKLNEARDLYLELAEIDPDNVKNKLRYGVVEFRLGNKEKSVETILEIKDQIDDNAEDLMIMAEILGYSGEKLEPIKLGYKALKLSPHDPRINIAYIHIFLARGEADKSELLVPKKINKNTAVKLKIDGYEKNITIIDSNILPKNDSEIPIDSETGKNILDLKIGDKISIGKQEDYKQTIEILDIKSIYVKAFQNCIQNFSFLFPEEEEIKVIKAGDNLENIFDLIDKRAKRTSQFIELYKQQKLTIGFLANLLGINLFDTWAGLINSPEAKLICSSGNIPSLNKEFHISEISEEVIIDLIGLFTVAHLDLLHLLPTLFKIINISQSSMDQIIHIIGIQSIAKDKGFITVGKYKDQYVKREVEPKQIEFNINHLTKIKNFIQSNLKIVGIKSPITSSEEKKVKAIGKSFFDSIRIAKENRLSLYSDDYFLRELAWNEHKVNSFSIQALLSNAKNQNKIKKEEYYKKIIELVLSNYSIISIDGDILFYAAKNSGFNYSSLEFIKLLEIIEDYRITLQSAINVLSDFLKSLFLEPIPDKIKNIYLDLTLEALTKSRGINITLEKFRRFIQNKFKLMPIHYDKAIKYINMWKSTKLIA